VRKHGRADRRIEATVRAAIELGDVLGQAVASIGVLRVDGGELDARGGACQIDQPGGP